MYIATVLPHGSYGLSGKGTLTEVDQAELAGTALVKVVLPLTLVDEFDTWIEQSLQPRHVDRPDNVISEYKDLSGCWAGLDDLQVIYYMAVETNKLEDVQQFATEYTDLRE